ncbi:NACHT domain-containing protein [Paractinoplanes brasiliensis]|uniref:NACHT N-terminal Helical domain-containing protein n=1 Tax=Paractinoplanes brasiliensis TaxID=52695 RepID=A0A4V3C8B7_9ACTN|nr:hypothetical protein [Actinoplanes brasiliensis]TDO41008.1 hypothetical protein C8E87_4734 [Actinoplanes brasiliensis]GID26077.1 hypothetical protein Abr02nite_10600 [Actinoplanes brasiliensis]
MPQGLSYADAVRILGGSGPLAKAVDNLLGGALSVATAGGSDLAVSLFDAKTEVVRLGTLVSSSLNDSVRGLGRYERSERLQAAHAVLVVAAFFESVDECLTAAGIETVEFSRDDQLRLVGDPAEGKLIERVLSTRVPLPSADLPYERLLSALLDWFLRTADTMRAHVTGYAVWEQAEEGRRMQADGLLRRRLPELAVERYDEAHRRLAAEIPEFAFWSSRLEARAATRGLERLEVLLIEVTSGRDPSRHRATLARAYRADLDRPVLGGENGELRLPALGAAYLDPIFRVRAAGPGARPADDHWWAEAGNRADVAGFLASYLTTTQATEAPLLLLGQPGAGKSSLTRILAARLPAADFFVCRVVLRDVPAEAEVQDQIEHAVRAAIGETVSWAEMVLSCDGALPVVLLDGFDELLQATGLHQSDYLQRVAAFQQREAALGRPVAVMVTSRVAVADRARLPAGALAVRLEPFDDTQIERWLTVWNASAAEPLSPDTLRPLRHLAEQPLLLLMLALYHATGNPLQALDGGQLYERLLASFAEREVRRLHAGQPDHLMPALVEQELLRLSVVAFAMFHRLRLWVTESELDADLAGLGLTPSRPGRTEAFRTPLTAGQEMIGRFFFIQRAQAVRDDQTLQTYEFLHATFGEYLVARLVVQAIRDTEARERASTLALRMGPAPDDDLLRSLLGFTSLTARATVLPFLAEQLAGPDRERLREWLAGRTSQAVTRPTYTESGYRPVDKRVDHWMATYSFNLLLLTLACGDELRASELFTKTDDPAYWMRGAALQWQAAVPSDMYMDAVEVLKVTRVRHEGKRDIVLKLALDWTADPPDPMDVAWFNNHPRGTSRPHVYRSDFELHTLLRSMHLSNSLGDNTLLHALEPLLERLPAGLTTFVTVNGVEQSVARGLVELWLSSVSEDELPEERIARYARMADAIKLVNSTRTGYSKLTPLFLQALCADIERLPGELVSHLASDVVLSELTSSNRAAELALQCLLHPKVVGLSSSAEPLIELILDHVGTLDERLAISALHAVLDGGTDAEYVREVVARLKIDDRTRLAALEGLDPRLAERLDAFR